MSLAKKFEKIANPDSNGESRWIHLKNLPLDLQLGNGWSWGRQNGYLKNKYIVKVKRVGASNSRILSIKLSGYNSEKSITRHIRSDIKQYFKNKKCVITHTSKAECDHKNGRYNDKRLNDIEKQRISDFQPLHKDVNKAKRQRCKECSETGIRFDAKKLGYPISYYFGDRIHSNKSDGCVGCFWYDPIEFRKKLIAK